MRRTLPLAVPLALAVALGAPAALGQDADRGEQVFKRACAVCHMVGPGAKNRVGPPMNGIVDRKAGSIPGFAYSPANRNSGVTWDADSLKAYLRDPRAFMPGTRMVYAGLRNDADLADLVAYLARFGPDGAAR
ncbi:cytochrome c family protein [Stella sp.]|uniref:c-type cytochrome n=1 Tax=Stella sp. TaxID=2912054 RepID=UPI0035ADC09E